MQSADELERNAAHQTAGVMKRKTYFSSSQRKDTERHGRVVKSRKMLLRQIRHLIGSLLQSQTACI
ncbi:hypothetical protein [Hoylesella timonensis]|uniref:hypothetical protein n=1 Tax=Hoylesella timonensis TaxID=386414 RepID=UPI00242DD8EA|nr:hypothetical protein [Hoylesella timonensis]